MTKISILVFVILAVLACSMARATPTKAAAPKKAETPKKPKTPTKTATPKKSTHKLQDQHEKLNKTAEEQVDYDREVLLGGNDNVESIHDMSEEEQQHKLKLFMANKMDADKNGFIEKDELVAYTKQAMVEMQTRELVEEFTELDENKDGQITWKEFSDEVYGDIDENQNQMHSDERESYLKSVRDEKKLFGAADKNGDGKLSADELRAFRHPVMTEETKKVSIEKILNEHDKDKNGTIDVNEYIGHLMSEDDEEDENKEWIKYEKEKFTENLDLNKDGVLSGDEILKLGGPQSLDERALEEAVHLIKECDANRDGKLTEEEILNNHSIWLHTDATNFGKHIMDEL